MARVKDSKGKTIDFTMEKEYRVDGLHYQTKERVTFIKLTKGQKLGKGENKITDYTNTKTGCVTTGIWVEGYYKWGGHDGEGNWIIPCDFFLKNVGASSTVCTGTNADGVPAGGAGKSTPTPVSMIEAMFKLDDAGAKKGGTTVDLTPDRSKDGGSGKSNPPIGLTAEEKLLLEKQIAEEEKKKKEEQEAGMGFWGWTAVLAGAGLMYKYVLTK